MQLRTITELTRQFNVSPRTLRYYEQIGLVESIRTDDYAYRSYDEANCLRLSQIVLLRKLRIPIKQIAFLLQSDDAKNAISVFQQHIQSITGEIDALDTLRSVLTAMVERLNQIQSIRLSERLLSDDTIRALIQSAPEENGKLKEVRTMSELNQADNQLGKLRNVRIVYLPPATVAASHYIGDEPENVSGDRLHAFGRSVDILKIKPDTRVYGFNHPNPMDETGAHGYEFWMTIPDDLEVPEPLTKRHFEGGLYAAHAIKMGDFHEWQWLDEWVRSNGEYVYRGNGSPENMFDSLEEHLNVYTFIKSNDANVEQLDLLIPVRKKED